MHNCVDVELKAAQMLNYKSAHVLTCMPEHYRRITFGKTCMNVFVHFTSVVVQICVQRREC